jgi:hypothetical protein
MERAGEDWGWLIWVVGTFPIWGTLLWHIWDLSIRPRLIPVGDIKALADDMIANHGPRAEEIAFIEEDRAWRYSETFEQGKWRRVRKHIERVRAEARLSQKKEGRHPCE